MGDSRNPGVIAGVILVVVGGWWLATQFIEGLGGEAVPLLIGIVFLALYFYNRTYGLLVAGGILTGVGVGQVAESATKTSDGLGSIGLGLGFLAIYAVDLLHRGNTHWWPLIPGGILLVTGLASLGGPLGDLLDYAWPVLLIGLGVVLILRAVGTRRQS